MKWPSANGGCLDYEWRPVSCIRLLPPIIVLALVLLSFLKPAHVLMALLSMSSLQSLLTVFSYHSLSHSWHRPIHLQSATQNGWKSGSEFSLQLPLSSFPLNFFRLSSSLVCSASLAHLPGEAHEPHIPHLPLPFHSAHICSDPTLALCSLSLYQA